MRVLDLFAGLRGWSDPWNERGHETFTVDIDERFDVDLHLDILELTVSDLPWRPDVVLASPPCEAFSVMTIGRNWTLDHQPKTDKARLAIRLVEKTRDLIETLRPAYFVIENPRAKLRKLDLLPYERRTVTYCRLGEMFMKPTDLWGGFPPSLVLPEMCKSNAPCHISASRGSRTGIQGQGARWNHPILIAQSNNGYREDERERARLWRDSALGSRSGFGGGSAQALGAFSSKSSQRREFTALAAKIPRALSLLVCEAAERDISHGGGCMMART